MTTSVPLFTNQDVTILNDGNTVTGSAVLIDAKFHTVVIEVITSTDYNPAGGIILSLQRAPNGTYSGIWDGQMGAQAFSGIGAAVTYTFAGDNVYMPAIRATIQHADPTNTTGTGSMSVNLIYQ